LASTEKNKSNKTKANHSPGT